MSEHHHHHPKKNDQDEQPVDSGKPLHHRWGFYVAGLFLFIALVLFTFGRNLEWISSPAPLSSAAAAPPK